MMKQVLNKHFSQLTLYKEILNKSSPIYKEIAAVKCIIDFRIAYYDMIGKNSSEYREAAIELHRKLNRTTVTWLNAALDTWAARLRDSFLVRFKTVKGYINHYRQLSTKIS